MILLTLMLKFLNRTQILSEEVEIDDYIPLVIRWVALNEIDPKLYWSLASKNTLLEIGMDEVSQSVRVLKLVLTGDFCKSEIKINAGVPVQVGLPVFDTKIWNKNNYFTDYYFREEGKFDLHVGKNNISIFLSENEAKSQIVSDRVRFGFDKDNCLCVIEVDDFSPEEMKQLIDTLEYQKVSSAQ